MVARSSSLPDVLPASALTEDPGRCLGTGIPELNELLGGGIPRGRITTISGSPSSGKTSLLFSILQQAVCGGDRAAFVDAFDALDPGFARRAGVSLSRLLWVRCDSRKTRDQALLCTDILCRAGCFGVVVLDAAPLPAQRPIRFSTQSWFRLQRSLQGTETALLVLSGEESIGGAAAVRLSLQRRRSLWSHRLFSVAEKRRPLFEGMESEAQLMKGKRHGRVTVYCHF